MKYHRLSEGPPDGGYGWVVVACCAICYANVMGIFTINGLVVVEVTAMYDVSRTQDFLIVVLNKLFNLLAAPVIGKLYGKLDCNFILCAGNFLISLSFILTAFTTAYWQILVTYGCLQGIGVSCLTSGCLITVGQYFEHRRSLATGIFFTAASIGSFIFPVLFSWLTDLYMFNGALLVMGGISLHGCAFAMLVRQPKWLSQKKYQPSLQKEEVEKLTVLEDRRPPEKCDHKYSSTEPLLDIFPTTRRDSSDESRKSWFFRRVMVDLCRELRIFGDGHFLLYLFTRMFSMMVHIYIWAILPDFVQDEMNVPKIQVAFVISISSMVAIVFNLCTGVLLDVFPWHKKHSFAGATVLLGVTSFAFQFTETYNQVFVVSVLFGVCVGLHMVIMSVIEVELMGPQRVYVSNGFTRFVVGFAAVTYGVAIGLLRDALGSYNDCFSLLGGMTILVGLVWIFEPCVINRFPLQAQHETNG